MTYDRYQMGPGALRTLVCWKKWRTEAVYYTAMGGGQWSATMAGPGGALDTVRLNGLPEDAREVLERGWL